MAGVAARSEPVVASGLRALHWRTLLSLIVVVVFFIPIKRFSLPASLPFNLEPYRLLIGVVALVWMTSLLIDRRLRLRSSGLGGPAAAVLLTAVASIAVNAGQLEIEGLGGVCLKALSFFLAFFLVFFFAVNVLRTRTDVNKLSRVIVGSGTVVAVAVLIEYRTHDNLFNHVGSLLPFLHQVPLSALNLDPTELERSGGIRAYGSSEDPIECSAVLSMLVPLAFYLFKASGQRRWLIAVLVLTMGVFGTLSRTGILMLAVIGLTIFRMRPKTTKRALPALIPAVVVIFFTAPHTLGSLYAQVFPQGGIIEQQSQSSQTGRVGVGDSRLARVGPDLAQWSRQPFFGAGYGSRDTNPSDAAALHVHLSGQTDDQWLGSLLDTGLAGVLALVWLFFRSTRRLKRVARADRGADGWLAVALVASIDAFMVGMFTFDALGFVQVTIVLFLMLALGSALVNIYSADHAVNASQWRGRFARSSPVRPAVAIGAAES